MRWAVVIRLKSGFQIFRREFDATSQLELTQAFRLTMQAMMDDAAMLSPTEVRLDVIAAGSDPPTLR